MTTTAEIDYLKNRIAEQQREIAKLKEKEQHDKFASTLASIYDSLRGAGFSEDRAWRLLILAIKATFGVEG